jgi:hypothetical protein
MARHAAPSLQNMENAPRIGFGPESVIDVPSRPVRSISYIGSNFAGTRLGHVAQAARLSCFSLFGFGLLVFVCLVFRLFRGTQR